MSSIVISGDTSGTITLDAPAVAGTNTITLPAGTGNMVVNNVNSAIVRGTAVASTSGTSIDFTNIPSWVRRITLILDSVSTNGNGQFLIQIGPSGGVETSSYSSTSIYTGSATGQSTSTSGFVSVNGSSSNVMSGTVIITNINSNIWVQSHNTANNGGTIIVTGSGTKSLASTLSIVRLTTTTGTDVFDSGTVNILYE